MEYRQPNFLHLKKMINYNLLSRHAFDLLQCDSPFLTWTIDELKKRISTEDITEYFRHSILFDNKQCLQRALSAYWDNDYLVSSHLFSPLIESAIRELVRHRGGTVQKPNRIGGYDWIALGSLLRDDDKGQGTMINQVFTTIDPNICFYFDLVLTNPFGMNLRNDFAHGCNEKQFISRNASDRLFHIMTCLSLLKNPERKSPLGEEWIDSSS